MHLPFSFLAGVLFFSLYQYFPLSSLIVFISITFFLISRKKILLVIFVTVGIFYAFSRCDPEKDVSDHWNKDMKVTGRFAPGGNAGDDSGNIRTFIVDTAWDYEAGAEVEELSDKDVKLPADFTIDYDDSYELLLETGKDRTRLNPGQPVASRLYGKIISAEDTGESPASLFAVFEKQRNLLNRYISGRFSGHSGA